MPLAVFQILVLKQSIATLIVAMIEEDFTVGSLGSKVTYI